MSSPSEIIGFEEYYSKIYDDIKIFLMKNELEMKENQLKTCIKEWYEGLSGLYEYEKMTVFYNVLKDKQDVFKYLNDLDLIAELLDVLQRQIRIEYDEVALIVYNGNKEKVLKFFESIDKKVGKLSDTEVKTFEKYIESNDMPTAFGNSDWCHIYRKIVRQHDDSEKIRGWRINMENNMYKIFKEMSSDQIKEIIKDIVKSKEKGMTSEILVLYARKYFEDINSGFEKPSIPMNTCLNVVRDNFVNALFDRILENDSAV